MMKKLWIALVFSMIASRSIAQSHQSVSGTVADSSSHMPLPGAHVYTPNRPQNGNLTDHQGHFSLDVLPLDTLYISFVGYKTQMIPPADMSDTLQVWLVSTSQNIQEVIIEAPSLVAEEFAVKRINRLEIYTNPTAKADPLLAVSSMPAATTLDESANISLRGNSPAATGIFLDNVPVYDAVRYTQINGLGTFSIFNTSMIEDVTVFPGNPPLEFGNTSAGVVALQSDFDIAKKASISIGVSLANIGLQASLPLGDSASLVVFANYQPSGVIKALNEDALQDISRFSSIDHGLQLKHQWKKSRLKLFNYTIGEGYTFSYQHPSYQGAFEQNKLQNLTIANFEKSFRHGALSINQGLGFSKTGYATGNLDMTSEKQSAYLAVNYVQYLSRFTLKSGLTADYRKVFYQGQLPEFYFAMRPEHPSNNIDGVTQIFLPEVYLYSKYQLSETWQLGLGIRKDLPLVEQSDYLSTQLNIRFDLDQHQSLRMSGGKYHQYIIDQERFTRQFLTSRQLSLDYVYTASRLNLTTSAFGNFVDQQDVDKTIYGLEVASDIRWSRKLRTLCSYTYLHTQSEKGGQSYLDPYDLNYFLRTGITYQGFPMWTFSGTGTFRQGIYFQRVTGGYWQESLQTYQPIYENKPSEARLPDYKKVDISISRMWSLSDRWYAVSYLNVSNLMNWKNTRSLTYNHDYSTPTKQLLSRRTLYFGILIHYR